MLDEVEEIDFDRPEAWALKYFASVSMFTGMGTPDAVEYGSIEIGLEGGWIPSLSEDQRRVGFTGSKVEDLNRNSFFGRLRATFGLPASLSLTLGYSPPIERNGIEAEIFALALARPVYDSTTWRLGLRLHGQIGSIEGDLICPADVAGLADPDRNPDGCLEPSRDEVSIDYLGLELSASPKVLGERWEPHLGVSANYQHLEFQVRARYSIFVDTNRLITDGWSVYLTGGLGYRLGEKLVVTGEVFYSPLEVVRDPAAGSENDGLLNARLAISYSIR